MTTKTICKESVCYAAPVLEVLDLKNEGVLCASGAFGIKDWTRDDQTLGV